MNADLSIAPQPASLDLAPSVRRTLSGPIQPTTRDAVQPPAGTSSPVLVPALAQQAEATRLKALLTDPRVQVSMLHDDATGRAVLRIKNTKTGEVVDQIPSEELLRFYTTLHESLVDERA